MLGLFLNDAAVGVYSFISMLVEGFTVLVVVKNNINPILAKLIHQGRISELKQFTKRVFLASFFGIFIFSAVLFFLYPFAIEIFGVAQKLAGSTIILGVLLGFMVLVSGWFPFDQILSQAGEPLASSYMYVAVMLFNLVGNLLLVPLMGILGAAVATGTSWIVLAVILNVKVLRIVKINLFPFSRT